MPSLAGFLLFIRVQMGVSVAALADTDPSIPLAYEVAYEIASDVFSVAAPTVYCLMLYNLAADALVNFGVDQPGQSFFANLRTQYEIGNFVPGLVQSTSNEVTSTGLMIPDTFKTMALADLALLKTPWGRQYAAFAQRIGSVWGLT